MRLMEDSHIPAINHEVVSNDFASDDQDERHAADFSVCRPLPLLQNADIVAFQQAQAAEP